MVKVVWIRHFIGTVLVGFLVSCGGGSSSDDPDGDSGSNNAPTISIQAPTIVNSGETVRLIADGYDQDGDPLTYRWQQISGSRVRLDDSNALNTTFLSPTTSGTLKFRAEVSDGKSTVNSNEISVDVLAYNGDTIKFTQNPIIEHSENINAQSLKIVNNHAYVASGLDGIKIYDVSTQSPQLVGSYTQTNFNTYMVRSSASTLAVYSRLSSNDGITILDISTATSPVNQSFIFTGVISIRDMKLSSDASILYVATNNGLRIYDLTDPVNPALLTLDPDFSYSEYVQALELIESGNTKTLFALSTAISSGSIGTLSIFDVTDPTNTITTHGTLTGLEALDKMKISGTKLYASGLNFNIGLHIIDITNFNTPVKIGAYSITDWAIRSLDVQQGLVYMADWFRGVAVIDATDPAQPELVGHYDTPGRAFELTLHNNTVYVADNDVGIQAIDVSSPSIEQTIRSLGTSLNGRDVIVRNGQAYFIDQDSQGQGVVAYDVTNPLSPSILGSYTATFSGSYFDIDLKGNHVITAGSRGLKILDVSDPASITLKSEYGESSFYDYNALCLNQDVVYVGNDNAPGNLLTIDISDLTNPGLIDQDSIAQYDYHGIDSLTADGEILYLGSYAGVYATNLTDSLNPQMENNGSAIVSTSTIRDIVSVAGKLIFTENSYLGEFVSIADVSDIASSTISSQYELNANGIAVSGRNIYVTEFQDYAISTDPIPSLVILDIADPHNPGLSGFFELPDPGRMLDLSDGYIYVATKTKGVAMMQSAPVLNIRYTTTTVGSSLDYTVTWSEFPSVNPPDIKCVVTGGGCSIASVDQVARNASITWSLPSVIGDHEIAIAIGDQHSFFSTKDRVSTN